MVRLMLLVTELNVSKYCFGWMLVGVFQCWLLHLYDIYEGLK